MTDQEKIKAYEEAVEEIRAMKREDETPGLRPSFYGDVQTLSYVNEVWENKLNDFLAKLDEKLKGV